MDKILVVVLVLSSFFINQVHAQTIEPFEQQLAQIRDPQECTQKLIQGSNAEIPFTLKVFYDTTQNSKLEFLQSGTSFPITQRTNQVMIFYTNQTDQYQLYMEMNYDVPRERQIYMETLSKGEITASTQEKYSTSKFCMSLIINTVEPEHIPTKEEFFGDIYYAVAQIPVMVEAQNRNTLTTSANITFTWILVLVVMLLSIITFIFFYQAKKIFNTKANALQDLVETGNTELQKFKDDKIELFKEVKEITLDFISQLSIDVEKMFIDMKSKSDFIINRQVEQVKSIDEIHDESEMNEEERGFMETIIDTSPKDLAHYFRKIVSEQDPINVMKKRVISFLSRKRKQKYEMQKDVIPNLESIELGNDTRVSVKPDVTIDKQVEQEQTQSPKGRLSEERLRQVTNSIDLKTETGYFASFTSDELNEGYKMLFAMAENPPSEQQGKILNVIQKELAKRHREKYGDN